MMEFLSEKVDEIIFVSFKGNPKTEYPNITFEELSFSFDRGNPLDKLFKSILWLVFAPLSAKKISKKNNLNLIYCDDSIPFYPFFIKLLVRSKCKVIMRLGDLQTGYFFASQGILRQIIFRFFHFIEVFAWRKIDRIVAISNPFKKYVERKGIIPEKISVVKESINLDYFFPDKTDLKQQYNLSDDTILIMFHGAIEKSKGVDVLVEAAKILTEKYENLYFIIVGSGTALNQVKKQVDTFGLSQRVILTGWVDFKKIPYFINGADIGIALRNENMANHFVVTTALMQYWACEKPLLAPNLDSIREIVIDGENAVLFESGNKSDLAKKIEYMIEIKEKWADMGKSGRKTVKDNFEKSKIGREMANLLIQNANQ